MEKIGFFFHADNFEGNIVDTICMESNNVCTVIDAEVFDLLGMAAIQGIGNPEDGSNF